MKLSKIYIIQSTTGNFKRILFTLIILLGCLVSFVDYDREFYTDKRSGKSITVWQRINGSAYIIPGKHYLPFWLPKEYFKTKSRLTKLVVFNKEGCSITIVNLHPNEYGVNNLNSCYYSYSQRHDFFIKSNFKDYPILEGEYRGIAVLYEEYDN